MGRMLEDLDLFVAQFANELEYTRPVGERTVEWQHVGMHPSGIANPLRSVVVIVLPQCFKFS